MRGANGCAQRSAERSLPHCTASRSAQRRAMHDASSALVPRLFNSAHKGCPPLAGQARSMVKRRKWRAPEPESAVVPTSRTPWSTPRNQLEPWLSCHKQYVQMANDFSPRGALPAPRSLRARQPSVPRPCCPVSPQCPLHTARGLPHERNEPLDRTARPNRSASVQMASASIRTASASVRDGFSFRRAGLGFRPAGLSFRPAGLGFSLSDFSFRPDGFSFRQDASVRMGGCAKGD